MSAGSPRLFAVEQEQMTGDDFYTPRWVFEKMDIEFDIDVAAPPGGISWIPSLRYFSQLNDGLLQPWVGRVWMNPPFSTPEPWIDKFMAHCNGVCLVPMSNGRWFHRLWAAADGVALPAETALQFVGGGIPIRTALAAFGPECVEAIGRLGVVRTVAA